MSNMVKSLREVFSGFEFVFDAVGVLNPEKLHPSLKKRLHIIFDVYFGAVLTLVPPELEGDLYGLCICGDKDCLLEVNTFVAVYDVYKASRGVGFVALMFNPVALELICLNKLCCALV